MGFADKILQAVRAWHIAATGLAPAKVIASEDKGKKPAPPYLTVRVGPIVPVGSDERREHADGRRIIAQRRATVTVQGFGLATDGVEDLLERAALALADPTVTDPLDAAGLTIERIPPMQYVPTLLDTAIEARYARDYPVTFRLAATPVDAVEFADAVIDVTYIDRDPDPDPLIDKFTAS